ncbi:MAG: lamin tail domain-containing protein, partial [Bacteroidota bacterium]
LAVRLPPSRSVEADSFALEFLVEMDFAPSGSNYCTLDLFEESTLGTSAESAINLRLGGVSGDQDALTGMVVSGGDVVLGDFTGTAGALGQSPAIIRLKLTYQAGVGYRFFADYAGGRDFVLQGEVLQDVDLFLDYLQITCIYTSSRTDKFTFDDLNYELFLPTDDTPPSLIDGAVLSENELQLRFDEVVTNPLASDANNYVLSIPGNNVASVDLSGTTVRLTLAQPLPIREDFTITVTEIQDEAGNSATDLSLVLQYDPTVPPSPGNLVITEFMADPSPQVGLPNAEYVEIFNPTNVSVSLRDLGVASGGTPATIDRDVSLAPMAYIVLVDEDNAAAFTALNIPVATLNLPSLTNGGDVIELSYRGTTLQTLTYTDAWYNDPERDGGGYSVEYIGGDDATCNANWRASLDPSGGTPGRSNSVTGMPADDQPPAIVEVDIDLTGITLTFDEPLDPLEVTADIFQADNGLVVNEVMFLTEQQIFLAANVNEGIIYTLTMLPDFSDCGGNFPPQALELQLAIPGTPAAGEVVINEVLFNPATGGSDFLELYNCSDKAFQIRDWVLLNNTSTSSSGRRTVGISRLFLPGEYLTFTPEPDDIRAAFLDINETLLLDQTLPTMGDDEGNITVVSADGVTLDVFDYNEDFHNSLLSPNDGVSLERLRQKTPTQDPANWYSAASSENFGTPTRPNSQARAGLAPDPEQTFSLVRETFSPNGDSFEDFLELQYTTDRTGFLARVRIFDAQGRPVRVLRRTELLAGTGTIVWDGADDEGQRAKAGLYVLFVELVNPGGEVREEKLVGVLAGER